MTHQQKAGQVITFQPEEIENPGDGSAVESVGVARRAVPLAGSHGLLGGATGAHGGRAEDFGRDLSILLQEPSDELGGRDAPRRQRPLMIGTVPDMPVGLAVTEHEDGLHP